MKIPQRLVSTLPVVGFALLTAFPVSATPFFMTHHSPPGAWSSMTFGLPGEGVGLETEALGIQPAGDLVVAISRGPGKSIMMPFVAGASADDYEGKLAGKGEVAGFGGWKILAPSKITRRLTASSDEFRGGDLLLRVTSPRFSMTNLPAGNRDYSGFLPALLVELDVDNSASDEPATGFLGLSYRGQGRIRALDWADPELAGIGFQDRWALAAKPSGDVFTIRCGGMAPYVETATPVIHPGGNQGGIAIKVPPRSRRTLTAVLAFHRGGNDVAQGMPFSPEKPGSRYAYTDIYPTLESVCHAALGKASAIREEGKKFDAALCPEGSDPLVAELVAQASQAYYANSSLLLDGSGNPWWTICEGQFGWRNTLDLAVDHLPFELRVHPWVARNVIDGFIERYSYHDKVRFEGEEKASRPGGISFSHDQGNYTAYSPAGRGGYEQPDRTGVYSFMTTEQLLNGAYCASACALRGGDDSWAAKRLPVAREILASMEAREERDDGLLSAQSDRVGKGNEITTYDALDESLKDSRGSLYIAVKTLAASLLLERWFSSQGDSSSAARAKALADRTSATLIKSFSPRADTGGGFPANLLAKGTKGDARVAAALEPLAVPLFCGLGETFRNRYPELLRRLATHGGACARPGSGYCIDHATGGFRLSSSTPNTWPSKVALTLSVLSWFDQKPTQSVSPTVLPELAGWLQVSSAKTTISDQINASTRKQLGGAYYPRLVSLVSLLPAAPAPSPGKQR